MSTVLAFAQPVQALKPRLCNVAVSRWNLPEFSPPLAIDDSGAAVFDASETGIGEAIFDWLDGTVASAVTSATDIFSALDADHIFDIFDELVYASNLLTEDPE